MDITELDLIIQMLKGARNTEKNMYSPIKSKNYSLIFVQINKLVFVSRAGNNCNVCKKLFFNLYFFKHRTLRFGKHKRKFCDSINP